MWKEKEDFPPRTRCGTHLIGHCTSQTSICRASPAQTLFVLGTMARRAVETPLRVLGRIALAYAALVLGFVSTMLLVTLLDFTAPAFRPLCAVVLTAALRRMTNTICRAASAYHLRRAQENHCGADAAAQPIYTHMSDSERRFVLMIGMDSLRTSISSTFVLTPTAASGGGNSAHRLRRCGVAAGQRPMVCLLVLASLCPTGFAQSGGCPISHLDGFNDIAQICCESSTGAADCSAGVPAVCTHECAMLLVPFWNSCGSLVLMLGDLYTADETQIAAFATGSCHHTMVLFEQ